MTPWDRFRAEQGLISVAEAARRTRVGEQAIRRALGQDRLEGTKIGGVWYVSESSLAEYKPIRKPPRGARIAG